MKDQKNEWLMLYEILRTLLLKQGEESPFGEGDFWLVDENWGGSLQKICIFKMAFLTKLLVNDIREMLGQSFPSWGVMVQLEIIHEETSIGPEGMVIFHDRVEVAWDTANMKRCFGSDFDW
jgi:hypothetical protein